MVRTPANPPVSPVAVQLQPNYSSLDLQTGDHVSPIETIPDYTDKYAEDIKNHYIQLKNTVESWIRARKNQEKFLTSVKPQSLTEGNDNQLDSDQIINTIKVFLGDKQIDISKVNFSFGLERFVIITDA